MKSDLQGFINIEGSDSEKLIVSFLQENQLLDISNKDEQLVAIAKAVAEIPWGMGRTIEEVLVSKKVGTCTGKHRVLQACFDSVDIPYEPVVCTFKWSEQSINYPEHLQKILEAGEEWAHGHNFVRVQKSSGQWFDLDVNWDSSLAKMGFITVENWDGLSDLVAVKNIIDRWDNQEIGEMKVWLIEALPDRQRERRKAFLAGLVEWTALLR